VIETFADDMRSGHASHSAKPWDTSGDEAITVIMIITITISMGAVCIISNLPHKVYKMASSWHTYIHSHDYGIGIP
jgi:hypothetical protein